MNRLPQPILHIEDEDNDVYLLQRAFVSAEIWQPVQVAKTAQAAISYMSGEGAFAERSSYPLPQLILLDLTLPNAEGLAFLQWRQQRIRLRAIPVLVLATSPHPDEVLAAYNAGANAYLAKPSTFGGWVDMVQAIRSFWLSQNISSPIVPNQFDALVHNGALVH